MRSSFVKTSLVHALTAAVALMAATTAASAEGSAAAGKRLAERWCASCHQIEPRAPAKDVAPPFASLGVQKGKDPGWIRAWLANPHPPMQGINLSRQQIDDIVAYLQSLAPAR
jgi:mono/diheme cytochrome c family protein